MGKKIQVYTNQYSGDLSTIHNGYKITKDKEGVFHILSEVKKMEVEPLRILSFIWKEYKGLLMVTSILFVFSIFYSLIITFLFLMLEFFLYKKIKDKGMSTENILSFLRKKKIYIYIEVALLALYIYFMGSVNTVSTMVSILALIHFYIASRLYLFGIQIKFNEVFKIKDESGRFYVWIDRGN